MKHLILISFLLSLFLLNCQKDLTAPEPESFRWPVASPESQGFDEQKLDRAFQHAAELPFMRGLVVTRNGYLVGERYYHGTDARSAFTIRSVSKSFLSALYGIALEQGYIATLDTPMVDYLHDYNKVIVDEKMHAVTLRHLLTMKAGFDSDSNILFSMMNSPNWINTALHQELIFYPGSSFRYSTVGTHLLSVILSHATGQSTFDYTNENLCKPLGITLRDWLRDPQGYYYGGSDMVLTPRDMARFGWLYLNNGNLDGQQIVPAEWITFSLTPVYTSRSDGWGALKNIQYGYLWWLGTINNYAVHMALGYGGQFILNFPELNVTIAAASFSDFADWDKADAQERQVLDVVSDYILTAVIE